MELINATRMVAGYTMGTEPSGRESLVVVVKGTFRLPKDGEEVRLHDEQLPLVMADTFTGEPGFSAPQYEVDFAPKKPRCDVILLGSAYAPESRPCTRVPVALRVGTMTKTFAVVGDRHWNASAVGIRASQPEPFLIKPISYDVAFGGVDNEHEDFAKHGAYMRNPVGRGYRLQLKSEWVDGRPLPNTEELDRPVERPDGDYAPMAFGPIGRNWEPRYRYAGTYDQNWLDNIFPFLPPDFDNAYFQAAPPDQQTPYLLGGEDVALVNLSQARVIHFKIPRVAMPFVFFFSQGGYEELQGVIDTIVLEPNAGRLTLSWRAALAIKRNPFEIAQVLVGRMSRGWWRARDLGKKYYPSLAHVVKEKKNLAGDFS